MCSGKGLLSDMSGQEKTFRAFPSSTVAPAAIADYATCRRLDKDSSMLQRFLDTIQEEGLNFATWSSAAANIPKLFRLLSPTVRMLARTTPEPYASGQCGPELARLPQNVDLVTAIFQEHMAPADSYYFISSSSGAHQGGSHRGGSHQGVDDMDDTLVVMFTNQILARLMAHFLLHTHSQQCTLICLERRLHKDFVRMSMNALAFAMDMFKEFNERAYLSREILPMPCTSSDEHLLIGHPDFWYGTARGALRTHKYHQLTRLAQLYSEYPLLLKLAGDRAWDARANHAHIYQKFVCRANRLRTWDPFKRSPHAQDTLDYSKVWLVPFDKHLDFMLRMLQAHPITLDHLADLHRENVINTVGKVSSHIHTTLTISSVHSKFNQDVPSMHTYPMLMIQNLSTVFGGFYEPREHGRDKVPWVRMSTNGKYRFGGRHDADSQPPPGKLSEKFRRGEADIVWLRAFLETLKYLKDEFATEEEVRRLFNTTLPCSEHIKESRERRKALKREKQQQKRQRPPRFQHRAGEPCGTKTLRQHEIYANDTYTREEARRMELNLESIKTPLPSWHFTAAEQEIELAVEQSIMEALEQAQVQDMEETMEMASS